MTNYYKLKDCCNPQSFIWEKRRLSRQKSLNITVKHLCTALFFILGMTAGSAQVTIGTGTASSVNIPINSNYGSNYSQQIFTKAQINAAGNITSITFIANTSIAAGNFATSKDWVVYMGHTTKTQFASTTDWVPLSGLTEVFNGVVSYPATVPGNVTITFTTPFPYNNTDNLVVAIDENTAGFGTEVSWRSTTYTGSNRGIYYRSDSVNPNPASPPTASGTSTTIPNVVLGGITPSCFPASAVTGVVASATSANLSWTAPTTAPASGYQWEVRSSAAAGSGATGLASSGTTGAGIVTATSSTLTPNTTYTLYVRSDCGAGDFSTWAQSSTFITPLSCFPATALSGTATSPTSANLSWTAPTTAPSTGYQWEVRTTGAGGSGATGLVDSGATVAGVLTAATSLLAVNTTYRLYVRSDCGAGDFSTWVQSSTFTTPLSCFPVTAVNANATSTTSANLSWTAPTTAPSTGYQWEVRTSGVGGSGATGLIDSGSTATGVTSVTSSVLTANTAYTLYVRSNCGAGDFSTWTATSSTFTTPCNAVTSFPWLEGFEATSTTVGCFRIINANSDSYNWSINTTAAYSRTGSRSAQMYTDGALSNNDYIITPQLALGSEVKRLKFWVRARSAGEPDEISIRISTTGANLADFSTVVMPSVAVNSTTYQELLVDLSAYVGTNVYIAFVRNAAPANGWYLYVDDVTVENIPADLPDLVALTSPATSSVEVGSSMVVNAQVFEAGLTDVEPGLSGQAAGIIGAIGISPIGLNTNPNTWTTWIPATYDALVTGANDGYKATIGATLAPGTYYYAPRFSLNGGVYAYGGINSSNVGGNWDGTTFNSGVLTINPIINDECAGAIDLTLGTQLTTTNVNATKSPEAIPTCAILGTTTFAVGGKDVWYRVTVPANVTRLDIETNNNSDTALSDTGIEAYRGACGSLVYIECDDDDSNDGNFSLLNLTGLTSGEMIYIRVWGYNASSGTFKVKASVPACGVETKWDGMAWSNGVPVAGIRAVIAGNYSGAGFTACALDITGTSQVVFTAGNNLTLNGLMNVASTASVTLESNANLVQTVNGSNTGNITVKRESAQLVRLDHTLWSSPVTGQKLFAFSPNTLTNRFYAYNTPTDTYSNSGLTATTDFIVAKGYGIRAANDHPETPATWMGSFTGNPNNGNKSFTLALTGTGFNLVGNPYPSVIDAAAFVAANTATINGTLYFYAHTLTMSTAGTFPVGTNYALWNATGQTAATLGTSGVPALVPNGKIQVGQGFLVKATAAGSANFTNAMREASNGNQFFRMASEVQSTNDAERHRFWLNLTNTEGTTFNQMLIGYVSGATQEVDNLYDGLAFGNEGSALSSRLADADYTIQGRALPFNQTDVVPLSFKAITPGNYSISLADMDGVFAGDQNVYIRDNSNGSINNIKLAPFAFTSEAGTFNNRFDVVYQTTLGTPESTFTANSVVAYIKNAQLNIQTKGNSMKAVSVYDVRGRLLFKQSGINNTDFVAQGLVSQSQVLLVQVTSENDEVVTIKVMF
ncbi:choice-of-anchor J domain-containing protein [Flavobacterium qiangtangense]|uniref:Choice-of-anchor J domain-containing protein n=1 Tax=Flavobacterium qiangtangense TaxID=1442595 RepID=A0ABW1PNI5_9FLAO